MRAVLMQPPSFCVDDDRLDPPLGLLYLAAALGAEGVDATVCDLTGVAGPEEMRLAMAGLPEADLYGVTCCCTNQPQAMECVQAARSVGHSARIVLGGPNPSALPEATLAGTLCDSVVVGEGEDAIVRIMRETAGGTPSRAIIRAPWRRYLDTLPFPAYELVDLGSYRRRLGGEPTVPLLSSRGCDLRCAHCNSIVMGGAAPPRFHSPEYMTQHVRLLMRRGFCCFRFHDDNFTANPDIMDLLAALRPLGISFRAFARVDHLTEPICAALAASGCRHLAVGLESLDPGNLRVLGKPYSPERTAKHLEHCQRHGITTRAYFMVGLPHDSDETILEFFSQATRLAFDEFAVYPLIPYPGTPIAQEPGKYGYEIVDPDPAHYVQTGRGRSTSYALRHRNFTEEDVARWHRHAEDVLLLAGKTRQADSQIAS